jgi:hypothetical protein
MRETEFRRLRSDIGSADDVLGALLAECSYHEGSAIETGKTVVLIDLPEGTRIPFVVPRLGHFFEVRDSRRTPTTSEK